MAKHSIYRRQCNTCPNISGPVLSNSGLNNTHNTQNNKISNRIINTSGGKITYISGKSTYNTPPPRNNF